MKGVVAAGGVELGFVAVQGIETNAAHYGSWWIQIIVVVVVVVFVVLVWYLL